jgi:hypothetical protein
LTERAIGKKTEEERKLRNNEDVLLNDKCTAQIKGEFN